MMNHEPLTAEMSIPIDDPSNVVPTKKLKGQDGMGIVTATSQENRVKKDADDKAWSPLQERDVGITSYMNPDLPGFKGILKLR